MEVKPMKKIFLMLTFLIAVAVPTTKADIPTALKIIAGTIGTAIVLDATYNSWPFVKKIYYYCKARPWWPIAGVITGTCIYHICTELAKDIALDV